jgi:hypothetical protein
LRGVALPDVCPQKYRPPPFLEPRRLFVSHFRGIDRRSAAEYFETIREPFQPPLLFPNYLSVQIPFSERTFVSSETCDRHATDPNSMIAKFRSKIVINCMEKVLSDRSVTGLQRVSRERITFVHPARSPIRVSMLIKLSSCSERPAHLILSFLGVFAAWTAGRRRRRSTSGGGPRPSGPFWPRMQFRQQTGAMAKRLLFCHTSPLRTTLRSARGCCI